MLQPLFSSRIARFAAVGIAVTLFFMGLNAFLGHAFGLAPRIAFLAAYPPALLLHFTLNKLWTFRDGRATSGRHVAEYLYSTIVTFLVQWPCFLFLQGVLKLPGWVAAGGANAFQMAVSYAFLRWRVFSHEIGAPETGATPAWHRLAILVTVLGASALLAWTTLGTWELPHFGGEQGDYYNLLVSGFRKGSLAMDIPVPEAIKRLQNPWDGPHRPPIPVPQDTSYYKGHYYLYFGVVPAVFLFWPFHALMGYGLPYGVAAVLYLVLAYLVATWLWLKILRDRFPRAGVLTKVAGSLVVGLSAGQLALARRTSIWEMPIGAGNFYIVCMIAASYMALRSRRPWAWLAAAGLALGLGVGCRPTLAAAGAGLAVLAVAIGWDAGNAPGSWPRIRRLAFAIGSIGVPLAAVMTGLLAYNWARFGNPLEFGLNYQMNSGYAAQEHHFRLSFIPFNLEEYFLRLPQWGRYFPFIHPGQVGPEPKGYYGVEYVYGALVVCPVTWWVVLCAGFAWKRDSSAAAKFAGVLLAIAVATTGMLACFNTAAARYIVDFLPWWLWLAMLGWAWLEDRASSGPGPSRLSTWLWKGVFAAFALVSFALAFFQSCVVHDVLRFLNPGAYHSLAQAFDEPAALWERMRGEHLGKIVMDVRFAEKNLGSIEPLVVTGAEYEADYFFVYFQDSRTIQLGFENAGDSVILGETLKVDPSRVHRIEFSSGSVFPPADHPVFKHWKKPEVEALHNWVRILFDGRPVVDQERQCHEGVPELLQIGKDVRTGALGMRFSGQITSFHREDIERPRQGPDEHGDVVLDLMLSRGVVPASQPMVVAGVPGKAEVVGLRRIDEQHFSLTYEEWGVGIWESPPIAVPPDRDATFRIRLGSILAPDQRYPFGDHKDVLIVWMNGLPVWYRLQIAPLGPNPPVDILANVIGSSVQRSSFDGRLQSWRRDPAPTWSPGAFRGVELDLAGHGDGVQPLVATGVTGRADTLAIEWLPGGRARLIYDHWSTASHSSREFAWDDGPLHHFKIFLPSLASLDSRVGEEGTGPARVEVDGAVVWEAEVPFYHAKADTFAFGRNPAGSSVTTDRLLLFVGDVRQLK